ncbi:MAG: hypothetical protein NC094_07320 [Bacteroidales bacterium]|nr:hypothetical protein [Lachnoclostridium sp.]MCM1384433.1 hypothetical protein [Lachnoclostridium sp.]MCM1465213.1 hypothetical protein [Bacteroidales bacterium]
MEQNIVEKLREEAVISLFNAQGMQKVWPVWKNKIESLAPNKSASQIFDLGDSLKDIFYMTNESKVRTDGTRSQSEVSGGGANWEALVCWYLNLCCIGRRTVVIKHNKKLLPEPISNAITVNYGTFVSNTESDLIAITFPNKDEYSMNKDDIDILDENGKKVIIKHNGKMKYNLKEVMDALVARDFSEIEIHIIQCKTNWNDNAQIPMLWDMIYSADKFKTNITVGREGYAMSNAHLFSYAFATVPTVKTNKFKRNSVAVLRVSNLSGGNYWGMPSISGIASSIKEMLGRNLATGANGGHKATLSAELPKLSTTYEYFRL